MGVLTSSQFLDQLHSSFEGRSQLPSGFDQAFKKVLPTVGDKDLLVTEKEWEKILQKPEIIKLFGKDKALKNSLKIFGATLFDDQKQAFLQAQGVMQDLAQLLGPFMPAFLRNNDGSLNAALFVGKSKKSFFEAVREQVVIYENRSAAKWLFSSYSSVIDANRYVIESLYEFTLSSKVPDGLEFNFWKLADALARVDTSQFIERHTGSKAGRALLRKCITHTQKLMNQTHDEDRLEDLTDFLADLSKALSASAGGMKSAASPKTKVPRKTAGVPSKGVEIYKNRIDENLSSWNLLNWGVEKSDAQKSSSYAASLMGAMDQDDDSRSAHAQEWGQQIQDAKPSTQLSPVADSTLIRYMDQLAAKASKPGTNNALVGYLAQVALMAADSANWSSSGLNSKDTLKLRRHILSQCKSLIAKAEAAQSQEALAEVVSAVDDFLDESLPFDLTTDDWQRTAHIKSGNVMGAVCDMTQADKGPLDALYYLIQSCQQVQNLDLNLSIVKDAASEKPDDKKELLMASLEEIQRSLAHGYRSRKWVSRAGSGVLNWVGAGDKSDLNEAFAFLSKSISQLRQASTAEDIQSVISRLVTAIQPDGVLARGLAAGGVNGTDQILGLVQSAVLAYAGGLVFRGLGLLGQSSGVMATQVAQRSVMGATSVALENTLSRVSSETKHAPVSVSGGVKDSLATGAAAFVTAFIPGGHSLKLIPLNIGGEILGETSDAIFRTGLDGSLQLPNAGALADIAVVSAGGMGSHFMEMAHATRTRKGGQNKHIVHSRVETQSDTAQVDTTQAPVARAVPPRKKGILATVEMARVKFNQALHGTPLDIRSYTFQPEEISVWVDVDREGNIQNIYSGKLNTPETAQMMPVKLVPKRVKKNFDEIDITDLAGRPLANPALYMALRQRFNPEALTATGIKAKLQRRDLNFIGLHLEMKGDGWRSSFGGGMQVSDTQVRALFTNANFDGATLDGEFFDFDFNNASFRNADLTQARLAGSRAAHLGHADLAGANMAGVVLTAAQMQDVIAGKSRLNPGTGRHDLRGVYISHENLTSLEFFDVDVTNANFLVLPTPAYNDNSPHPLQNLRTVIEEKMAQGGDWVFEGSAWVDSRGRLWLSETDVPGATQIKIRAVEGNAPVLEEVDDVDAAVRVNFDNAFAKGLKQAYPLTAAHVEEKLRNGDRDFSGVRFDLQGETLLSIASKLPAEPGMPPRARFDGANFDGADLSGQDLSGLALDRGSYRGTNFEGANLENVSFTENSEHHSLDGANFKNANLKGAHFSARQVDEILRGGSRLDHGWHDLSGVNLGNLSDSTDTLDFSRVKLKNVKWEGASLSQKHLENIALSLGEGNWNSGWGKYQLQVAHVMGDLSRMDLSLFDWTDVHFFENTFVTFAQFKMLEKVGVDLARVNWVESVLRVDSTTTARRILDWGKSFWVIPKSVNGDTSRYSLTHEVHESIQVRMTQVGDEFVPEARSGEPLALEDQIALRRAFHPDSVNPRALIGKLARASKNFMGFRFNLEGRSLRQVLEEHFNSSALDEKGARYFVETTFVGADLAGQNMGGLQFGNTDFRHADCRGADFSHSKLYALVKNVNGQVTGHEAALFEGALFDANTNFDGAELSQAQVALIRAQGGVITEDKVKIINKPPPLPPSPPSPPPFTFDTMSLAVGQDYHGWTRLNDQGTIELMPGAQPPTGPDWHPITYRKNAQGEVEIETFAALRAKLRAMMNPAPLSKDGLITRLRNWDGVRPIDFSGLTLEPGINLRTVAQVVWRGDPLKWTTAFQNADFSGATLDGVDLSGQDLSQANFTGASMRNVQVIGTQFSRKKREARLQGADFTGTDIRRANMSPAQTALIQTSAT